MKICDLKPAPYNPRKITKEQLRNLKKALEEFGDLSGIVFNRRTGNIVGGHQRIKIIPGNAEIYKIEMSEPTRTGTVADGYILINGEKFIYREVDWNIDLEKQANIAANAQGGNWDDEKLNELLKELSEMPEFDIDLTGFDTLKLDEILLEDKNELIEEDEIPDINQTITQVGDHYILGNKHHILCGDSTDINNINRLLNGEKIGMIFTDPPYGINAVRGGKVGGGIKFGRTRQPGGRNDKGFLGGKGKARPRLYKKIINDDHAFDPSFLLNLAPVIILWGANCYASKLPDMYGWIIWDKEVSSDTGFSACELAWVNKGNHTRKYTHRWTGMCRAGNRKEELKDRIHPTQKPVGLISEIFKDYPYNPILDLFLGSGSTLIAAEKMNRICYGMELDTYYIDLIVTRWCKYTGINKVVKNGLEIEWEF